MAGVCLVLTASTIEEDLRQIARYRPYLDFVELRVDLLDEREIGSIGVVPSRCNVPAILTIRKTRDGGKFDRSESERIEIFRRGTDSGFAFVDFEDDFFGDSAEQLRIEFVDARTRIIRSRHDFAGVPDDLDGLYRTLSERRGEIPKIAANPQRFSDSVRLYEAARSWPSSERIVLGMGSFGFFTRVLAHKLGSFLTFTSAKGESGAPGHIDPETLCEVFRYLEIGDSTRVFGVIADPVMHSKSPWIHNPAFEASNMDAVYVPFHVDEPETFFQAWDLLDVDGISVTVPHKERVIQHLASVDEAVKSVGACNTVVRGGNGAFRGMNTDVPGFLAAVRSLFDGGELPNRALVVGAGGTARSVVFALIGRGIDVMVVNRTVERARELAELLGCAWGPLDITSEREMREHSPLIVQTTSAGMAPNNEIDPLDFFELTGEETVYDVVYAPPVTKLLLRAEKSGCRTMNGLSMLLEQAYAQYEEFTGRPYPRDAGPLLNLAEIW